MAIQATIPVGPVLARVQWLRRFLGEGVGEGVATAGLDEIANSSCQADGFATASQLRRRLHPAGLNYGDCFSYALSKQSGEPPLFKGNDSRKSDGVCALAWQL